MVFFTLKTIKTVKVITPLLVLTLSLGHVTKAQNVVGFSVSPPTFELSANPGDTVTNVIKVSNPTDSPLQLVVDRRNFTAQGESGAVELTDENTTFSVASWIEVTPKEATIPPKSQSKFNYKIVVPLNAEPGGHFGSIVFRIKTGDNAQGASVAQEIGSLLLLKVAGPIKEDAEIVSFKSLDSFYEYGPVDFEIRTKNNGSVHIRPKGYVVISDFFGRTVAKVEVDPKNVLPGAIRKTEAKWNQKYLFSKYTATATLSYGSDNKTMTATTSFGGLPYKLVGIVSIVAGIVAFILFKGRHRIKKAYKVLVSSEQ